MTMEFLPNVKLVGEARNQKKIDITNLVFKLQTKIPKNAIFRKATSRHANSTKFWKIINLDVCGHIHQYQNVAPVDSL